MGEGWGKLPAHKRVEAIKTGNEIFWAHLTMNRLCAFPRIKLQNSEKNSRCDSPAKDGWYLHPDPR